MGESESGAPDPDDYRETAFVWSVEAAQEYGRRLAGQRFVWQPGLALTGMLLSFGFLTAVAIFIAPAPKHPLAIVFMAMAAGPAMLIYAGWHVWAGHQLQKLQAIKDPRKVPVNWVRIDVFGITIATDISSDFLSWFGVERVNVSVDGIFFRSGPVHGVYVPRYAFETWDAFNDFCEQARRYREHKRKPPHLTGSDPDEAASRLN